MKLGITAASILAATVGLTSSASAEDIEIWVRTGIGEGFTKLVEAYNAAHEDKIVLTQVPFSEMVQKYAIAIAGGEAPDALSLDLIYNPAFSAAGQLEDLTEWAKALPYFATLSPGHVANGTFDGKIYGLPLTVETSVLAWNKDLYAAAGLDPEKAPSSWDEITANAEKITALGDETYGFYFSGGNCGGCMIFTFAPLVWGAGADILSADGTQATLDTPQMRKAIDIYRNLVQQGFVPDGAATDNGTNFNTFMNGKIGMQSVGAFSIGTLVTQHPDINFGVTLIPGVEGGPSSFAGGDNLVITKGSDKVDAVKGFLEYAYSMDGQKLLAQYGSLPSRSDIAGEVLAGMDPRLSVAAEAVTVAKTPVTTLFNDLINSANGPWATFTSAAIFNEDVDGAFAKGQADMQMVIDMGQ